MMIASQVNIEKALAIGGWMSAQELAWLATQAMNKERIVEFGSLHGRSTRALADNTLGRVWAVDIWNGNHYTNEDKLLKEVNTFVYPYFKRNLQDHINSGKVIPVREFSYSFKLPFKVDMVFIDADHRYKTVVKDIKNALSLLDNGGLICGHDYGHPDWPGIKQAVNELVGPIGIEHTIWYTTKS